MTASDDNFEVFRIRMNLRGEEDRTADAWNMEQVGIWYGSWSLDELKKADNVMDSNGKNEALKYLGKQEKERGNNWDNYVFHQKSFEACLRFKDIRNRKDWVIVCFGGSLCLGQLDGDIQTEPQHKLSECGGKFSEIFHFRRVINKKCFSLIELPDLCKLIPSSGRGNVYHHNTYGRLINLLVKYGNAKKVCQFIQDLPIDDWLDFLSSKEWESLCLGYLIIEHGYLPTGLLPGRTLPIYDIVGKNRKGTPILAQCKKSNDTFPIEDDFKQAFRSGKEDVAGFWFSYGGASADPNYPNIKVIDKTHMKKWLETKKGKNYLNVFRGQKT